MKSLPKIYSESFPQKLQIIRRNPSSELIWQREFRTRFDEFGAVFHLLKIDYFIKCNRFECEVWQEHSLNVHFRMWCVCDVYAYSFCGDTCLRAHIETKALGETFCKNLSHITYNYKRKYDVGWIVYILAHTNANANAGSGWKMNRV